MERANLLGAAVGLAVAVSAQAQIIVNGDFETGDFSGWTEFGETGFNGVWDGLPHSGTYSGYFGPLTTGGIRQNLNAAAGARLRVSFWLVSELGEVPNSCNVTLDGQTVADVTDFTSLDYVEFTATITVTNANPELVFTFSNPPDYLDVDTIDVTLETPPPPSCYANCDLSTAPPILNVLDFGCFINRFAASESYANCDGSTAVPTLNVLDFGCFINKFAAGCT